MTRGTLNSTKTALASETFGQCWTLDSTGNWQGFREEATEAAERSARMQAEGGSLLYFGTWDLVQARTSNTVNEITDITNSVGSGWVDPAYNAAGNMTTMPQANDPTQSFTATYDGWNRLVKMAEGSATVSEYAYDGSKRRIVQKSYTAGSLTETRHMYYTSSWQSIEERLGASPDTADAERQFVWGLRYIDDCVLRDRDTNDDGDLDERLYALQDGNWNVTGIIDDAAAAQERYAYAAYGQPVFLTPLFSERAASSYAWESLYCGYRYESATGMFHVRNRVYHPTVGTWVQRDPLGYVDGMNIVRYCHGQPVSGTDAAGLRFVGELCAQCFGGYRRCIGRNGTFYARCVGAAAGGPLFAEITCVALCRWLGNAVAFGVCFGACTVGTFALFICGKTVCDDALEQRNHECGGRYNACSFRECGHEHWRPD